MAATLAAIAVSLAGVGYLAGTDPKRRRAFRLPPAARSSPRLGWALVLAPGVLLPFAAGGAGFTVWIGAVSVVGWAIAALPPERTARVGRRCAGLVDRLAGFRLRPPAHDRLAALEARIRALEAQLAAAHPAANGHEPAPAPKPRPRTRKAEPTAEAVKIARRTELQSSVAAPRSR